MRPKINENENKKKSKGSEEEEEGILCRNFCKNVLRGCEALNVLYI